MQRRKEKIESHEHKLGPDVPSIAVTNYARAGFFLMYGIEHFLLGICGSFALSQFTSLRRPQGTVSCALMNGFPFGIGGRMANPFALHPKPNKNSQSY